MSTPCYVGIDVAKATLDVATNLIDHPRWHTPNDVAGIAALVDRLRVLSPALIVLEATGGYETAAVTALAVAGLPVAVVNPRQVRDFAKALGILAKTDTLDADVLVAFAERVRPTPRPLPDEAHADLLALVARRRQLVEMRTAELNRLGTARPKLRPTVREHIAWLDRRIKDTDTRHGPRTTWGGRAPVRATLYMATLVATRHNPSIRAFYRRLRDAGKPPKVALVAAMRKLLTILNAILKHQLPWTPASA